MEPDVNRRPNETFEEYMKRILGEAKERYDRMSPEDQQLLDEAARRHGELVHSEIMVSFPDVLDDTAGKTPQQGETADNKTPPVDQQPDANSNITE
ncbi:hypothetical protein F5984_10130 [Rudanella paleaurantiibacter]|uniref:Uncharacterized protein n=1 Tax=Rudanella paleaurantiibacter TaxID=2614655 RepID=A0A7J5U080_9BACT|nr:hypothetical protein [Rudanella paleaurantiibacter]KAB7731156.1 hypothetical protein F5984_10130 [Rudanella paleaurantiibacter]